MLWQENKGCAREREANSNERPGKQWQGQFQFAISLQIEVNRGEQRLNEDIAASYCSASAQHPVCQQVMIKGFGTGFNLEEMEIVREKNNLKELIKQVI